MSRHLMKCESVTNSTLVCCGIHYFLTYFSSLKKNKGEKQGPVSVQCNIFSYRVSLRIGPFHSFDVLAVWSKYLIKAFGMVK